MVSSASTSLKTPSVSYADRAKGGTASRTSKNLQDASQQCSSQSVASSALITSTSTQPHTTELNAVSGSGESPTRPIASKPGASSKQVSENIGDAHPGKQPNSTRVSCAASQGAPVVNVWAARLQEKGQAQVPPPNLHQPTPLLSSGSASLHSSQSASSSVRDTDDSSPIHSVVPTTQSSASSTQDFHSNADVELDPFVIRMPSHLSRSSSSGTISKSPADDMHGWPEVGVSSKSATYSRRNNNEPMQASGEANDLSNDSNSLLEPDHIAGHTKSEKTKWIPIPARELQVAFDAIRPSGNGSSPERQYLSPPRSRDRSAHMHKSSSNSEREKPSGSRTPNYSVHSSSASQSVSHSRHPSHSGSLRSSPRMRSRGMTYGDITQRLDTHETQNSTRSTSQQSTHSRNQNGRTYAQGTHTLLRENGMELHHLPQYIPQAVDLSRQPSYHSLAGSPMFYSSAFYGLNGGSNHGSGAYSPPYVNNGYHTPSGNSYPLYSPYPAYAYNQAYPYWNSHSFQPDLYPTPVGFSSSNSSQKDTSGPINAAASNDLRVHQPTNVLQAGSSTSEGYNISRDIPVTENELVDSNQPRRVMVFGSIELSDPPRDPTPHLPTPPPDENAVKDRARKNDHQAEHIPSFSIGVSQQETDQSRSGSRKRLMKIPSRSDGSTRDSSGQFTSDDSHERRAQEALTLEAQLTGLNAQPKWTFGSTHHGDDTEDFQPLSGPQGPDRKNPLLDESSRDEHSLDALAAPNHQTGGTSEEILPVNTDQIATISLQHSHQDGSSAGNYDEGSAASDDFEVKDYGYGFGDVSGSEHALEIIRQQKLARERQRIWDNQQRIAAQEQERERERAREMLESERERKEREWEKELEHFRDQDKVTNRPRRGSFSGSYSNYDRGNYRGRRGRGFGGRGYGNRYPGRGGYHQQRPASMSHVTPPPFRVNPVAHLANHVSTYSQPSLMEGYISPTLDPYLSMPVPLHPQSLLTLPIAHSISPFSDNTRTYLLSQLEYYLSPQNMAQDFFLRQRMDDSGWIPISLLASFNRVRNLTTDTTLVAEVLQQSNVVEVDGEFVRMSGQQWEQFILPRQHKALSPQPAPASTKVKMQGGEDDHSNQPQEPDCEADDTDCYVDDEDEEDVVFVIGEEAEGSWLPERRQL